MNHIDGVTPIRRASRRASALAVSLAALILSGAVFPNVAMAQANLAPPSVPQSSAAPQIRMQAPIGHRQPRPQDLPPSVRRDEARPPAGEQQLDKALQICRPC